MSLLDRLSADLKQAMRDRIENRKTALNSWLFTRSHS